ncbi:MAG: tRNA epoxyqueuosine(34) reductase QueG [Phycisphaerae bacterium]|nr:tRNA epoxyqueuosine(34) reductase QueG [Phycisphaerae bacterium]
MIEAVDTIDASAIARGIRAEARRLGFDLAGIAPADPSKYADHFRRWMAEGNAGTMQWLTKRTEERCDPRVYFPGTRSIICVAMNYHVTLQERSDSEGSGRIARYALGDDYHEVIKGKMHRLADWLQKAAPGTRTRCGVDTAPIMERELAARAGIGWIGKNTCVIHPRVGSWILLGEVLTTLDLPSDEPIADHCGSCSRCIDACPTGAIEKAYHLDARKCISYLTIEHRGELDERKQASIGDWLFGCDICQDVCPFNRRAPEANEPAFQPRFADGTVDLMETLSWRPNEFNPRLSGSAMKRVKLPILQRNARSILQRKSGAREIALHEWDTKSRARRVLSE